MLFVQRIRKPSLTPFGAMAICIGMALSLVGTLMADPENEAVGYISAEVLTGVCLLIGGALLVATYTRLGSSRTKAIHLVALTASIAAWFVCWLLRSTSGDLPLLLSLAGLHGLIWGLWCIGLALYSGSSSLKASLFCMLGSSTCSIGIILATHAGVSKTEAVTASACYMAFLGAQALLVSLLLLRNSMRYPELAP